MTEVRATWLHPAAKHQGRRRELADGLEWNSGRLFRSSSKSGEAYPWILRITGGFPNQIGRVSSVSRATSPRQSAGKSRARGPAIATRRIRTQPQPDTAFRIMYIMFSSGPAPSRPEPPSTEIPDLSPGLQPFHSLPATPIVKRNPQPPRRPIETGASHIHRPTPAFDAGTPPVASRPRQSPASGTAQPLAHWC